jgi:chromate transporter
VQALTPDRSLMAALVTAGAAVMAFATRINPLCLLAAGGLFGFAGLIG